MMKRRVAALQIKTEEEAGIHIEYQTICLFVFVDKYVLPSTLCPVPNFSDRLIFEKDSQTTGHINMTRGVYS